MGLFSKIAGPVLGAAVGGGLSFLSGESANKASAKQAALSRGFTNYQLRNRHQLEVADLRDAGLNPILSANATPSIGGSAQGNVINPADAAIKAFSSAFQAKLAGQQIENLKAENARILSTVSLNNDLGRAAKADAAYKLSQARVSSNVADISSSAASVGRAANPVVNQALSPLKHSARGITDFIGKKYFQSWKASKRLQSRFRNFRSNFKSRR